jgi:RNA polymerase sigma-70 factor (ECF subfamily)
MEERPVSDSFAGLRQRLRTRDDDAAAEVVHRLARRLNALARSHLDTWARRKVEPEDVTQSVFRSFFNGYQAGRFDVRSWQELWQLLAVITAHKCLNRLDYLRAKRRDAALERGLTADVDGDGPDDAGRAIDPRPGPPEMAILAETVEELLGAFRDDDDRAVVELSLMGHTAREISERLGLAERSVTRLRSRVKEKLERMRERATAEA